MEKKRHNYTAEEKVTVLKRHLVDKIPVSDICDQYNLQPTVFYRWQKEFFENGAAAFNNSKSLQEKRKEQQIQVSWFSVNRNFLLFELAYSDKGEFNGKETAQLHSGRKSNRTQTPLG